jgi:hypothetical protein
MAIDLVITPKKQTLNLLLMDVLDILNRVPRLGGKNAGTRGLWVVWGYLQSGSVY